MAPKAWMPNLVDGVPIWKDVRMLNAPDLLDGRLLVPRVSKKDPTRMRWDVSGLMPLAEAKEKMQQEVAAAIRDLGLRVERTRADLAEPSSSNHRLAKAFSVPRLDDPREAKSYYFDPNTLQLRIANWGATRPPSWYANDREDDEGPMSAIGATQDLGAFDAASVSPAAAEPMMTKEQEAAFDALATQIEGDLAETREALEMLDVLLTKGEPISPT